MISIQIQVDERLARRAKRAGHILTRPPVLVGLTLALLAIPISLVAAPVPDLNEFAAGTPASASEINDNFDQLRSAVDDKDDRLATLEAANPLPSATGVTAYVTTSDGVSTLADSFNSNGGSVTVTGTTGDYTATFQNIACTNGTRPIGTATVVPYVASTAVNCRIGAMVQTGSDCEIFVRCFDSSGSLRAGAISLLYVR